MKAIGLIFSCLLFGCAAATKQAQSVHAEQPVAFRLVAESVEPGATLGLAISTNPPLQDFRWATTNHTWFISRQICWTAMVSYAVSSGSWLVEWNYSPVAAVPVENGYFGMRWIVISSEIFGPGSGVVNLAVPPEPSGFFRLRKL